MKRCLMLLVVLATVPQTFALRVGEFPIAPLPLGFAPHDRRNVEVAASDTLALAVWEDDRVDPAAPRIWAARVQRDSGALLDPTGISVARLSSTPGSRLQAVGSDGPDFLVG